ncbi:MAG: fused MFS/spermidine synthase [Acidobacteriia bacterium]|nr:fused MFS/spermidine synthase [Terriglobia bacterium]
MTLYAITIFLSAFLLFQVQPLIAKIILPWFGGSAAVWAAAMLFFQLVLLAGYAYSHAAIRYLRPKSQAMVHGALLLVSCALLPILPNPAWKPTGSGDPTLRILGLLAATIGLPYFLLSSTSPLLQAWYVRKSGSGMPYRLFALSNFGSMLALISFPFLVEPQLTSREQAFSWSGAYILFAALCAFAAWASRHGKVQITAESESAGRPSLAQLTLWVALAACASILLVSITNHLSQNVAPIPFLWVVPLALYLLTFIFAFESDRIYQRWLFLPLLIPALGGMAYLIWADSGNLHIKKLIPGFCAGLFVCCMVCHGELARRRPAPSHLTLFYLMVSLGGAIGGMFVAFVAPHVFNSYLELQVGLGMCAVLAMVVLWGVRIPKLGPWPLGIAAAVATGVLISYMGMSQYNEVKGFRLMERNFYGVLHVRDDKLDKYNERVLLHGTINHGEQVLNDELRYTPTSYYGIHSGVGRAVRAKQALGPARVGVIGLGAGVLSTYGRQGDYFRIYEINPLVERIAQTEFSFYPHSAADKKILLGDARLTLERQEAQNFDILAVDAFSSDAIPIHLLTREALALYFRHLKPDGILALHVSNRYLDLIPVCARGAQEFDKVAMVVSDEGDEADYLSSSTWVLLAAQPELFHGEMFKDADITPGKSSTKFRTWTDDYSNIFQILKLD